MADGIAYAVRPGGAFTDAIDATLSGGCETYLGAGCEPLWSAPITGGAALAASGPSLYATDASGIAAYATGPGVTRPDRQPAWTAAVSGAWAPALTPAADAITLLVGADDGLVRAHPADGCGAPTCTPSWTAALGGHVDAPVIANGIACVASSNGHAYALPATGCGAPTCAPLWSGTVPGTPPVGHRRPRPPRRPHGHRPARRLRPPGGLTARFPARHPPRGLSCRRFIA